VSFIESAHRPCAHTNCVTSNRASQPASQKFLSPISSTISDAQPPNPRTQVFYAIVQHDFVAERPDELDAKRGDAITVVAQSNREWFVAKPIGRLGRPGLIPVSFVEIHDPATGKVIGDVDGLIDRGDLPKVEEWKRAMLNYKQNSIALGVIDAPIKSPLTPGLNTPSPFPPHQQQPQKPQALQTSAAAPPRAPSPDCLPEGILLSADVVSFHYEMEEYWFRIDAVYQPYNRPGQIRLPPSKNLILFRVYNDFYDFQVSLLEAFPREAGRHPPEPRTLPYMPGPAQDVDDELTATRRVELDEYIHGLCNLARTGQRYVLEHLAVRTFLALKPGDVSTDGEPRTLEVEELLNSESSDDWYAAESQLVQEQMDRMGISDKNAASDGSEYEDEGYAPSAQPPQSKSYEQHPYSIAGRHEDRLRSHAQNHSRSGSSASFNNPSSSRSSSPYRAMERNVSPGPVRQDGRGHPYQQHGSTPSVDSYRRKSPSVSSQTRLQPTASNKSSNPPISAGNPQTAFVKIKIFDRVADDLIAIRVHPKVTHAELMEKVQSRLGTVVTTLRFRDSMTNTFVGLDNDEELRAWMEGTDKHVLYAD
jgi:bud emergence protein 1